MPTFKADFAGFDSKKDNAGNLQALIEQYNALVQKLCATLNNLDEENFSDAVRQKGESDNE
ncbi:MAG: hypothetical protein IJI67_03040 [Clostridia bacterium]|nr:hypothetical protein [Clostridia bacterium]